MERAVKPVILTGDDGLIPEPGRAVKEYTDRAPLREVDVHEGLENTLTILELEGGVERDYDRSLPRVRAHGGQFDKVWANLIDNAVDAMRDGDGCVEVEIPDNGPGIAPEVRNRVFEPFFTTKGVGSGTGLGLDIARRIVNDRHGGDIRVDSEPGQTRFRVRLPVEGPAEATQRDGG